MNAFSVTPKASQLANATTFLFVIWVFKYSSVYLFPPWFCVMLFHSALHCTLKPCTLQSATKESCDVNTHSRTWTKISYKKLSSYALPIRHLQHLKSKDLFLFLKKTSRSHTLFVLTLREPEGISIEIGTRS